MHLTQPQARRFLLTHQGLLPPYEFQGKAGVLDFIRRVGCIQYDPLDVVGQNPSLVLQARVAGFQPAVLSDLLYQDRVLLEGLDKVMSIYCVEDWPYFSRWRQTGRNGSGKTAAAVRSVLDPIRAALQERGPLSSNDLKLHDKVEWDWSHSRLSRAALESMYFWGELVVHHRIHTRKVYDFAHRCLPPELLVAPDPNPTEEGYQEWHVERRIGSVGLLWNRNPEVWLGMHRIQARERKAALQRLLAAGRILQVEIDGFSEPFYLRTLDHPRLLQSIKLKNPPPEAVFMAPLDNLLWDRRLLKGMFGFEYRWEVYVPAEKRRYGYYVLPVLYGDRFIARFEPVLDKKRRVLIVKNWWWEPGVTPSEEMKFDLLQGFRRFLGYLGAERLELSHHAGLEWLDLPHLA